MKLGDVVFQNLPKIPISILRLVKLIYQVQGNVGPEHCGICTGFWLGIPMITEAFLFGVWTIPLPLFLLRWPFGIIYRTWNNQGFVALIISFILSKKGMPYNIYYTDSDNAYYCSSIIAKAYNSVSHSQMSCTKTIAQVELSDEPAVSQYIKILGQSPNPTSLIWLVSDLQNAKEFVH